MSLSSILGDAAPIAEIVAGYFTGGLAGAAMMVGGAMTEVGKQTNSQALQSAGGLIGMAGTAYGAYNGTLPGMGGTAETVDSAGTVVPTSITDTPANVAGTIPVGPDSSLTNQITDQAVGIAPPVSTDPTQVATPAGIDPGMMSSPVAPPPPSAAYGGLQTKDANAAAISQLGKYNLLGGVIGGIGQAIGARTNADIAAQEQANILAFQQQQASRANSVGTVPLTVPNTGSGLLTQAPVAAPATPHAL